MKPVLIIAAYFVVASILYGIACAYEKDMGKEWDDIVAFLMCAFWPLGLVIFFMLAVSVLTKNFVTKMRKRFTAHWIP